MYRFLNKNNYIENSIQKGFVPGMTGTFEHTAHLAQTIKQAKLKQRSIVVTLLDLKNAFGEVHHNIIPVVLEHHHVPEEIVNPIWYGGVESTPPPGSFLLITLKRLNGFE